MLHTHSARARFALNRKSLLTGTSALAAMLLVPTAAMAQEQTTTEDEALEGDIVVSGFRAALGNAQDVKRDSDTVVDVISAEDIGALPDRSVAEALQRVPGVNISRFEQRNDPDRFSVEGSGVIIRGLPFVRSELNGRDIFSANGGRELSFNDVSPELLGRVEVYKNTTADMLDGGIAGTVNLVTRKPLDTDGVQNRRHVGGQLWRHGEGMVARFLGPYFQHLGIPHWAIRCAIRLCSVGIGDENRRLANHRSLLSLQHVDDGLYPYRCRGFGRLHRRAKF